MATDIHAPSPSLGGPPAAPLPAGSRYLPDVVGVKLRARAWSELLSDPGTFGPSQMLVDGHWHDAPRLVASFANTTVQMEGMLPSIPWPQAIDEIRELITQISGQTFNYGLANLYRDGADFAGWHADKAAMHHPGSVIAIVSLGAVRTIEFRAVPGSGGTAAAPVALDLEPGSVLLMDLPLQARCEHRIAPTEDPTSPRISVTLRSIPSADGPVWPTESSRPAGR